MLTTRQAGRLLGIDEDAIKRHLRERPHLERRGGPADGGAYRLPHATLRDILHAEGKRFHRVNATIGMEKGGVGKSFLTVNTAVALAMRGCRVLVLDLDPEACATNFLLPDDADYGSLGTMLEVFTSETLGFADVVAPTRYDGLDLVACKPKARRVGRVLTGRNPKRILRSKLDGVEGYDCILFEVPPTFGDVVASAYLTSDIVIMPVVPDIWAIESLELTMEDIREECENFECPVPEFRIVVNRYSKTRNASRDAWTELDESFSELLLPLRIPESAPVQNALNDGVSIFEQRCPADVRDAVDAVAEVVAPVTDTSAVSEAEAG